MTNCLYEASFGQVEGKTVFISAIQRIYVVSEMPVQNKQGRAEAGRRERRT